MDRSRKKNAGHKRGSRRRISRFLGICLSVALLLSDSLPAYAAGAGISAGDGILWEAGAAEDPETTEIPNAAAAGETAPEAAEGTDKESGGTAQEGSPAGGSSMEDGGSAGGGSSADGSVSTGDGLSVSAGDGLSVSAGDGLSVSAGDAGIREAREPESFHKEPEPENYGELVSYDAYSRTYHAGGNRYVTAQPT